MADKKYGRFERGERVDQPDFQQSVTNVHQRALAQAVEALVFGGDQTGTGFVLGDAFQTTQVGNIVTVTRGAGTAILTYRDEEGNAQRGAVIAGGAAAKNFDGSGLAAATYNVWIRFSFRQSNIENRFFWNPSGTPQQETQRSVSTRFAEDWEVAIEQVQPGPEWIAIAEVAFPFASPPTDLRPGLYEDPVNTGTILTDSDWGDANDRSDSRGANGVTSIPRFARAVFRQLQDIIGGGRWYSEPIIDLVTVSTKLLGTIIPSLNNTFDLGSDAVRYRRIYADGIVLGTAGQASNQLLRRIVRADAISATLVAGTVAGGSRSTLNVGIAPADGEAFDTLTYDYYVIGTNDLALDGTAEGLVFSEPPRVFDDTTVQLTLFNTTGGALPGANQNYLNAEFLIAEVSKEP